VKNFFADFDARLGEVPFVAGQRFSVADITALVTVDFAAKGDQLRDSGRESFADALVRRNFKPIQHGCVVRCGPRTGDVRRMK
jgi:glutathione S-transferase